MFYVPRYSESNIKNLQEKTFERGGFIMSEIIVALDTDNFNRSKFLIDELICETKWFKVGMEAYFSHGDILLEYLKEEEANIFLDLKLHDIPVTVAKATKALITRYKIDLFNLHCLGGSLMLENTAKLMRELEIKTKLIGVTILTAHSEESIKNDFNISIDIKKEVVFLAQQALKNGCSGIVCSPHEIEIIKEIAPKDFTIITPGIRFGEERHDQKRVMTPREASQRGATHLVIGREITQSQTPKYTLQKIKESLWIH